MSEVTPFMTFDLARVRANARRFRATAAEFFPLERCSFFYAVKANPDPRVLSAVAEESFGFEVMTVSQLAALPAGAPVIVSGFHKPGPLLENAEKRARYLVVENPHEVERANDVHLVLRVKLGPDRKIGCDFDEIAAIADRFGSRVLGLHFHAGWNVKDEDEIRGHLRTLARAHELLVSRGVRPRLWNFGGSFCEDAADPAQLGRRMRLYREAWDEVGVDVHFEPGRYLVGDAGDLISEIVHVDERAKTLYVDTSAYGYRLTAGTPSADLLNASGGESRAWRVFGFWPAEGDQCTLEIAGTPKRGDRIRFRNMGAYTWDMPLQFEPDRGVVTRYQERGA